MLLRELFENGKEKLVAIPEGPKLSGWQNVRQGVLEVADVDVRMKANQLVNLREPADLSTGVVLDTRSNDILVSVEQGISSTRMKSPWIVGEIIVVNGKLGVHMVYGLDTSLGIWVNAVVCIRRNGIPD